MTTVHRDFFGIVRKSRLGLPAIKGSIGRHCRQPKNVATFLHKGTVGSISLRASVLLGFLKFGLNAVGWCSGTILMNGCL